jgi:hypothetical protein
MAKATQSSWKILAAPQHKEPLAFESHFSDAEAEKLKHGLIPQQMEDKWFVYFADGWLNFHRSWTGAQIYALRLEESPTGVTAVDSWVNREPEQYKASDTAYDRKLLTFIIDALLLNKNVVFPLRAEDENLPPGIAQHSAVGRGYAEKKGD